MIEKIFLIILILYYIGEYSYYIALNKGLLKSKLKQEIKIKVRFIDILMKIQYIYGVFFILQIVLDYRFSNLLGSFINAFLLTTAIYLAGEYIVENREASLLTAFLLLLTNILFFMKLI